MNRRFALFGIGAATAAASVPIAGLLPAHAQETPEIAEMTLGDASAPVEVIEYASYTCPHCQTFHAGNFELLKAEYIDTGRVHFIYREVYFDRFGLWASMVARCGGEDRFFGITDLIYERQADWTQGAPADIANSLRRLGKTAGLTDDELDACFADQAKAEALVAWYQENAEEHAINSTPSFVINGTTHRNMEWSRFSGLLDEAVEAAG